MIKKTRLSLNRVRDRVEIKEGNEMLELVVDADCMRIVPLISDAREKMIQAAQYEGEGKEEKEKEAALNFARVIFGTEQAEKLEKFYLNDAACIAELCGRYFTGYMARKITKAQKKAAGKRWNFLKIFQRKFR